MSAKMLSYERRINPETFGPQFLIHVELRGNFSFSLVDGDIDCLSMTRSDEIAKRIGYEIIDAMKEMK